MNVLKGSITRECQDMVTDRERNKGKGEIHGME